MNQNNALDNIITIICDECAAKVQNLSISELKMRKPLYGMKYEKELRTKLIE